MEIEQYKSLNECLQSCKLLMNELERNNDKIKACLKGELLTAYLKANERAAKEIQSIYCCLQNLAQ